MIECAKTLGSNVPVLWDAEELSLVDMKECTRQFFVRVTMEDRGAVINSFEKVQQIDITDEEFAFITDPMTEKEFDARIKGLREVISVIRVENEE